MREAVAVGNTAVSVIEAAYMKYHTMRVHAGVLVFAADSGSILRVRNNLFARLTDDRASPSFS